MENETAFPMAGTSRRGMDLRDYFAAQALIGLLAYSPPDGHAGQMSARTASEEAYKYADAMMSARKPKPILPKVELPTDGEVEPGTIEF